MGETKQALAAERAAWAGPAAGQDAWAWLSAALLEGEGRAGAVLTRVLADLAAEARVEAARDAARDRPAGRD